MIRLMMVYAKRILVEIKIGMKLFKSNQKSIVCIFPIKYSVKRNRSRSTCTLQVRIIMGKIGHID